MTSKFPQRKIGDTFISAIGLGRMSLAIPPTNDEESLALLTAAVDLGINFWITSDAYSDNELLLGRWFRETGRRDEIFLTTKFGRRPMRIVDRKPVMEVDGSKEYVKAACAKSLERLGTDQIGLYSQHRVDPDTPIEETVAAMAELKAEGKIRYLGLSECSARTLRRAYSQTDFLATATELGVIIVYSPLGKGFLTRSIKRREHFAEGDARRTFPRFLEDTFAGNLRLVEGLEGMAGEKGCTTGQLVLTWILAQGEAYFIPIPGTKHIKYLKEIAAAIDVKFSKEDNERIRGIIESVGGTKGRDTLRCE